MSALMNCCITLKAPEFGGMANNGLPSLADFGTDHPSALRAPVERERAWRCW